MVTEFRCRECGLDVDPDAPDPCLGILPGVAFACCGHGGQHPERGPKTAYLAFENGVTLYFSGPLWASTPLCNTENDGKRAVRAIAKLKLAR